MSIKPRKIRKINEEIDLPMQEPVISIPRESVTEASTKSNIVQVRVLVGTLQWEQGTFQKGDTFTCSLDEVKKFGNDVEIVSS